MDVVSVSRRSWDVISKRIGLGLVETWKGLGPDLVSDWKSNDSVSSRSRTIRSRLQVNIHSFLLHSKTAPTSFWMQGVYIVYWFTSLLVYCNTSAWVTWTSFLLQHCTRSHRLNDHHLQLIVICCHLTQPLVNRLLLPCLQTQKKTETVWFYVHTATTQWSTEKRTTWCFKRLSAFDECSAVGLDVFNDPSFATSLRPIAMKLFCAPCSSAASERVFSQSGLIMRPTRSCLSPSTLAMLVLWSVTKTCASCCMKWIHVHGMLIKIILSFDILK